MRGYIHIGYIFNSLNISSRVLVYCTRSPLHYEQDFLLQLAQSARAGDKKKFEGNKICNRKEF